MATMDLYNDYFMNEEVVEERKEQDLRIQKYIYPLMQVRIMLSVKYFPDLRSQN